MSHPQWPSTVASYADETWQQIVVTNKTFLQENLLRRTGDPIVPEFNWGDKNHVDGAAALVVKGDYQDDDKNVYFITLPFITDRLVRDGFAQKLGLLDEENRDEIADLTRSTEFAHEPAASSYWKHAHNACARRDDKIIVVRDDQGTRQPLLVDDAFLRFVTINTLHSILPRDFPSCRQKHTLRRSCARD